MYWKCALISPVSASTATPESVKRLSPSRTAPSKSGHGLPVPKYRRFSSGSKVVVTQQLAPPRCQASPSSGQVSEPGSPGFGTM